MGKVGVLLKDRHEWYRQEYKKAMRIIIVIIMPIAVVIAVLDYLHIDVAVLVAIAYAGAGTCLTLYMVDRHERHLHEDVYQTKN